MSLVIVLDTGVLSLVTHPNGGNDAKSCSQWFKNLLRADTTFYIPEIADYELRRELIRADKTKGLERLDAMITYVEYIPITTKIMRKAALLWAKTRNEGRPTASDQSLDGDMILCSQVISITDNEVKPIVATTNVKHFEKFVDARKWQSIDVSSQGQAICQDNAY